MSAAAKRVFEEPNPLAWAMSLRRAMSEILLEAMSQASRPSVDETMRKWLAHARPRDDRSQVEPWLLDSSLLATELTIFTPSFSGTRTIDRVARRATEKGGDHARAAECLRAAEFRLFRVTSFEPHGVCTARDLATGASFRLWEDRFAPSAMGVDLAARLAPMAEGLHALAGPIIPLAVGGVAPLEDYVRPGKGVGNDQRRAALVYRDYVRQGAAFGTGFGIRDEPEPVRISRPDEELDAFVAAWLEEDADPVPTGDALADARALSAPNRIIAAVTSCVELRVAGLEKPARVYGAMASLMLATLLRRAEVGSGDPNLLERLRSFFARASLADETLALLAKIEREVVGPAQANPDRDEDLSRVIERIRALRAKTTEQGCTEQEALRAAEKVAELLERYGLTLSEIEMRKQTCEGFGVDTGRRKREAYDRCIPGVADFCDCRVWTETSETGTIRYVFFGLPADIEAARCLHDLVAEAFETETDAFKRGALYGKTASGERRGAVASFQIGMSTGISAKLAKLKAARVAAAQKSTGRDLMIVKKSILDEELERLGFSFHAKKMHRRRRVVAAAFAEGQVAADRFKVNETIG